MRRVCEHRRRDRRRREVRAAKTFEFEHATTVEQAIGRVVDTGGKYYAGGTNLLDLMKGGVEAP
ncbi:MAG: xanthine dehydrogenase family protein subunit M, partial [Actinomycetota bacterium]|nr:xanthine dehydrogenase family protein subunit M [Actinomycetota bacterium]